MLVPTGETPIQSVEPVKKLNMFDWLNDLNENKTYLFSENVEREFYPFMINRALSQNVETIMYANEMNKHSLIPKEMVHDFYFYLIPKKKRYGKWSKADKSNADEIELLVKHYGINRLRAVEYLKLLTSDEVNSIKELYAVGGKTK